MFRHQRSKVLFDDEVPADTDPIISGEVVSFVVEQQTAEGRDSIDNVHAPTDLTYLIDNQYDVAVSVQAIGGIYDNVAGTWSLVTDVGDPVSVPTGLTGYLDVFPGNPYMQDYGVEITAEEQGQGEDGVTVIAIYAIDQ